MYVLTLLIHGFFIIVCIQLLPYNACPLVHIVMLHGFMQACLHHALKPVKYCAPLSITVGFRRKCNKTHHCCASATLRPIQHIPCVDYVGLIRQCTHDQLLRDGKCVHAIIVENGDEQDTLVMNLVVQMYGKCNALRDACATFQGMEKCNVFTWTIMIGAYAQGGLHKEALRLFRSMEPAGVMPNKVTFITVISLCASMGDLAEGKVVHSYIEVSPFIADVKVGNALVHMYDRCGSVQDASLVFEKMLECNAITWNALIATHTQHGQAREACQLFQQMQLEDVLPDNVTFVNTLDAYASQSSLRECKRVHAHIVVSGFEPDVVLGTAIVCMYAKCGSLPCALMMFTDMPLRNTISWNAVLAAHEVRENEKEVLQLFHQMLSESVIPDKVSSVTIFSACANNQGGLREGKRLHARILHSVFDWDSVLWNALINMYGKGGNLKEALRALDETPTQDVSSWNAVIAAHGQHNHEQEANQFFQQMLLECVMPNMATFVSIINACANKAEIVEGKHTHARIVSMGFENNMCEQKSKMVESDDNVEHECVGNLDSAESKATRSYAQVMKAESNLVVGNALLNMYSKCQNLEAAQMIFDKMPRRDVITWTAIIAAYAQQGHGDVAFRFFFQMQEVGVNPNNITFISVLDAFANQAALVEGQLIHFYLIIIAYEIDTEVGNAAMSMYGKCGSLEDAQRVFDRMGKRNVVSWTTLISTYSHYGLGKKAYMLYLEMQNGGIVPTSITLVSVLSACSHAGLVDEGCQCFDSMNHVYGISPTLEHYNCMVDLLARVGKVEEGIRMIHKMPMGPTATTWMTLLGACKMHQNVERALYVAEKIVELEPKNATPYVLLYNIFSAAGRCDDAAHVRRMMIDKGLKKPLGRSSIVVSSKLHEFSTGDRSHPRIVEVCAELERLVERMKREADTPMTWLAHKVEEEEEEGEEEVGKGKCFHSEKLAVAFGLINTPPFSPLILTKNLRVCMDCHSIMKYISKVTQRQIVLRDNCRFHRFREGMCSCADYWWDS